jgi:hypothetical protein
MPERCRDATCRTRSWEDGVQRERCFQHGSNTEAVLRVAWTALGTWPTIPPAVRGTIDAWERAAHEHQHMREEQVDAVD